MTPPLAELPVSAFEPGLEQELAKLKAIEAAMAIARRNAGRIAELSELFCPEVAGFMLGE
jgi:hypothetical protein